MSLIINPNAPPPPPAAETAKSALDHILDTMRIIANYRQSFFDLEAAKQCDGVAEVSATDIDNINNEQQRLMQDMVSFILYGDESKADNDTNL